jgi:hypothetical protein
MDERRCEPRSRRLKAGTIIFNNKNSVMDCQMRDQSAKGARLSLNNATGIPEEFQVTLPGVVEKRWARKAWMKVREIGVEFI